MGQNRKKLLCCKIRIFYYPWSSIFQTKNGSLGYGAKLCWGPPRVQLGANGVPLGPKMGQNHKKITMSPNSNFQLSRSHRFFTKNGSYGYGAKSRLRPPRVHLWANEVQLGKKKWVKTVKNYHAPKFEFSTTPQSSIFPKIWKWLLWHKITVVTS